MSNTNDDGTELKLAESVGEILRLKREEKKLSIAEVSSQLRLLSENIQHIEKGEWHALHGRPYARGYFISYVKLLGLNEEEMLTEFNAEYTENSYNKALLKVQNVSSTDYFKWGRLFFSLALIVLVWFAYQAYQDDLSIQTLSGDVITAEPNSEEALTFE